MKRLLFGVAILLALMAQPVFSNNVAQEPWGSDRVRFVSTSGSDSNDGLSMGTAYRTIGKALSDLAVTGPAGDVYIGSGVFVETVAITKSLVHLHGVHGDPGAGRGTIIKPPCDTCDGIDITAPQVVLEDLAIGAQTTTWRGVALSLNGAAQSILRDLVLRNPDGSASATTGGTGLSIQNSERVEVDRLSCSVYSLCLSLGTEATEGVFTDTQLSGNFRDLLQVATTGGTIFNGLKAVSTVGCGGGNGPIQVIDLQGSENVLTLLDADEGCAGNHMRISGSRNTCINCKNAPETTLDVTGTNNLFLEFHNQATLNVTGTGNVFLP